MNVVAFYHEVVLPALQTRLDQAFPEFGFRRDAHGWVATNQQTTHRLLGARADRVVAHGPAPAGLLVHGGQPLLWTTYLNGGQPARGRAFIDTVRHLAQRAGIDAPALAHPEPRDRRTQLLADAFDLRQAELRNQ